MFNAYKDFWKRGTLFCNRSTRSQYWWVVLCNLFINLILIGMGVLLIACGRVKDTIMAPDGGLTPILIGMLFILADIAYGLISLVPRYALATRRFRDAGFSGWWIWVYIIIQTALVSWYVIRILMQANGESMIAGSPALNFCAHAISIIVAILMILVDVLPSGFHKKAFLKKNQKN